MNVLNAVLIGLAMGAVFGFVLEKSRVFEPGMIVGQMQLNNFIMLKIFLAAVAAGLIVLALLNGVRERKFWPSVSRIDNPFGDRNLFCTCPPLR